MSITRWTPDTHDCVVEYEYDENTDTINVTRFVKRPQGDRFDGLDNQATFNRVHTENLAKNLVVQEIMERDNGQLTETITPENGEPYKEFKPGKRPNHSYDNQGKLHIQMPDGHPATNGLITAARNELRNTDIEVEFD